MATTYALGGEFSSDEEIDRIEQQSERLAQSKFNDESSFKQLKPTKSQVDDAIATIHKLAPETDVNISDELLAALLDHFKIPRGPIVDSTRKLYKKIVLRTVRGEPDTPQVAPAATNGDKHIANNNNNNINNDNNNVKNGEVVLGKPTKNNGNVEASYGSSDEDDPMPPISSQSSAEENIRNRLIEAVTLSSQPKSGSQRHVEPMEVDPDAPVAVIRDSKQDLDDSESESTESSSDDDSVVGDKLDIEPATVLQSLRKASTPKASATKSARKTQQELKPQGIAKRRPNTRSQGVAARLSFPKSGARSLTDTSNISDPALIPPSSDDVAALSKTQKNLTKSTDRLLSRAIKFN